MEKTMSTKIEVSAIVNEEKITELAERETYKAIKQAIQEETSKKALTCLEQRIEREASPLARKIASEYFREAVWHLEKYIKEAFKKDFTEEELALLKKGYVIACIVSSSLDSKEYVDRIIEEAGKKLARDIRLNPSRNKRLAEVLKETMEGEKQ